MSDVVIKVEGLSKQYRLGMVGTGTIRDDVKRWWAAFRGKEDPFLQIGEVNKREEKSLDQYVWALRDINFDVKQGEVLGIIGRNGAGKSTLLKILSKVTQPTTGSVKIKGRLASLLEVGTGFHPDLSGRDNIYQNGAILGMTRKEIKAKFDEIVEFSGVARYIDTPVKRYSSGMHVRLAFAVAAHLDPEILIIDEVLAVGDAEFQKKCLGKMKSLTGNEGRTVLFVSHNMQAIANLCDRTLYLVNGQKNMLRETKAVLDQYVGDSVKVKFDASFKIDDYRLRRGNGKVRFCEIYVQDFKGNNTHEFEPGDTIVFRLACEVQDITDEILCAVYFKAPGSGEYITHSNIYKLDEIENKGRGSKTEFIISLPNNQFKPGFYDLFFWLGNKYQGGAYDIVDEALPPIQIKSNKESMVQSVGYINIQSEFKTIHSS